MPTPINGPGDVKVGDLVEIKARNGWHPTATVTKVTDDKVTARLPDGKTTTQAYTWVERTEHSGRWAHSTSKTMTTWHRLSARERWSIARPSTPDIKWTDISRDAIRDRPDDVKAQIDLLSAWLKAEPDKDAP